MEKPAPVPNLPPKQENRRGRKRSALVARNQDSDGNVGKETDLENAKDTGFRPPPSSKKRLSKANAQTKVPPKALNPAKSLPKASPKALPNGPQKVPAKPLTKPLPVKPSPKVEEDLTCKYCNTYFTYNAPNKKALINHLSTLHSAELAKASPAERKELLGSTEVSAKPTATSTPTPKTNQPPPACIPNS